MRTPLRSVGWLLPFMLTACFHKAPQPVAQALAPPIVDTPLPNPGPPPADLPPPVVTAPANTNADDDSTQVKPLEESPKPRVHHRKPANTEQASNGSPEVSAIGQLSPGGPSDLQRQTVDSIASTERGLSGISRTLNDQEQKTVAQIREFLKQAKSALNTGDVDGAHTLALKAKVLLGEISQ